MDKRRRVPNKDERIAACLLMLKRGEDWLIPEPIRSTGTVKDILACVQWDHGFYHALGGDTRPQNITPRRTTDHKEKSRKDNGVIAKSKRVTKKEEAFRQRLLAKATGEAQSSQKPKAKIRSRGFPTPEERKAIQERYSRKETIR